LHLNYVKYISTVLCRKSLSLVEFHDLLAGVAVVGLEIEILFPHLVVAFEHFSISAPHPLLAGYHRGNLNVHEKVNELQTRHQVFER